MAGIRFLAAPFRTDQPLVLVLLVPVIALLWWQQPAVPLSIADQGGMPLYMAVVGRSAPWPWLHGVLGLLAVAWLAPLLASTANNAELFDRRNRMPAILILLIMGLVKGPLLSPALCGALPLLFALRRAWAIQGRNDVFGALFGAGMLIGIAALFYMPYAFMVVALWAAVSVMRPFDWRDYAMPLAGAMLTFYFCWGILRLAGQPPMQPIAVILNDAHPSFPVGKPMILAFVVLVPMLAFGVLGYVRSYQKTIMRERNSRLAFLALCWALLAVIALEVIVHGKFPVVLIALPLAVVITYPFLVTKRGWLAEVALFALLAIGCAVQWG